MAAAPFGAADGAALRGGASSGSSSIGHSTLPASSVFGPVSGLFVRSRSAAISRDQDSFSASLPRCAGVELRQGSEVNVRPCRNGPRVCSHDEPVDQTEARKFP
jgi:hypothetical protein